MTLRHIAVTVDEWTRRGFASAYGLLAAIILAVVVIMVAAQL